MITIPAGNRFPHVVGVSVALLLHGAAVGMADEAAGAMLVSDVESVQPGRPFKLGVLITLQDDWHTYWMNPGDSGMAPRLEWQLPEGFTAGPLQWPAPQRFEDPPLVTFGYRNAVLLFRAIQPPATLVTGRSHAFEVKAAWLICKEACVPFKRTLQLSLPASADPSATFSTNHALFTRAGEQVPLVNTTWSFRTLVDPDAVWLCVLPPDDASATGMTNAVFFPALPNLVKYDASTWTQVGREYRLRLARTGSTAAIPPHLDGVLVLPSGDARANALEVHAPVSAPQPTHVEAQHQQSTTNEGARP